MKRPKKTVFLLDVGLGTPSGDPYMLLDLKEQYWSTPDLTVVCTSSSGDASQKYNYGYSYTVTFVNPVAPAQPLTG